MATECMRRDTEAVTVSMHPDELEVDEPLVRRLLAEQFPDWGGLLVRCAWSLVARITRCFDSVTSLVARLPRVRGRSEPGSKSVPPPAGSSPTIPTAALARTAR